MSATIIGLNNYTLTAERDEWSKAGGYAKTKEYRGPIDKLNSLFTSLINDDTVDTVKKSIDQGIGVVEVQWVDDDGDGGQVVTLEQNSIWELDSQEIIRDIRAHPFFNQGGDQDDLENVRAAVEKAETYVPAGEPSTTYLALLQRQSSDFFRSAAILRRSIRVGPRSLVTASWKGVDRAWKLNGELGSPNLASVGESAIIGALSEMPDYDEGAKQWLKRAPRITSVGRRKYSINQEWWFSFQWSNVLYEGDYFDDGSNP